ncbi:MAG: hypothetical protein IT162_02670 [Bryobacterales bacterium]|nr:hypothetical protein [Bryobacterales bacterium]
MKHKLSVLIFVAALASPAQSPFTRVDPPAQAESGMPYLTAGPDGTPYLSWTDTLGESEHALRFSRWTGTTWTPPETIAQGRHWFVNWADFPSLAILPDGAMRAHWLTRADAASKYGYGIRVAQRAPGLAAAPWREIYGMSIDEKVDYAGFLAFVPGGRGAIYLAPPPASPGAAVSEHHAAGGHDENHRKTVRFVNFAGDGSVESDREVDASACSCCPTALGVTRNGLVAAYRDRWPGEIRDISVIRYANGAWTQPKPVHADGWKIHRCPTEGPSIAAEDTRIAVAWLTRAQARPRVQVAFSSDEGQTFSKPVRIDSGNPQGRPHIVEYGRGHYLITWLEKTADGRVEVRLRRVSYDGKLSPPLIAATTPPGRAAGFPKLAVHGEQILLAWRDERVRAAVLTKQQLETKETK